MENVLELYLMLYRIEQKIRREISLIIKASNVDLTFDQWLVLRIIVNKGDEVLQSEIAKVTSKDKGAINRICKILKEKEFIETKSSSKNLLYVRLRATEKGIGHINALAQNIKSYNRDFNKEYFDREYNALVNLIKRMLP